MRANSSPVKIILVIQACTNNTLIMNNLIQYYFKSYLREFIRLIKDHNWPIKDSHNELSFEIRYNYIYKCFSILRLTSCLKFSIIATKEFILVSFAII